MNGKAVLLSIVAVGGLATVVGERAVRRYYASTPPPTRPLHRDEQPAMTPLWRENLWGLDWLSLRMSPVYRGRGIPHGDGDPVVVVPGLLLGDWYLNELHDWLARIGYAPRMSAIGVNADCLDVLGRRLLETIDRAAAGARRVHLVGHSLGGALALSVAARRLDRVASVTTLGTPMRGLTTNRLAIGIANLVRAKIHWRRGEEVETDCFSYACSCETVRALQPGLPPSVALRSVYSRTDGVADWRYCLYENPALNTEVRSTHLGLVAHPDAYRAVAENLAIARERRSVLTTAHR